MYYKFNGFTQKLVGAGAAEAYNPQGLRPFTYPEAPAPIFATPTKLSGETETKTFFKNKVPELQKLFQKPDGLPVHLKRGFPDRLLYRITVVMTIAGLVPCILVLCMPGALGQKKN